MQRYALLLLAILVAPVAWAQSKKTYPIGIESTPPGAEVVLDGKPLGYTPYKGKVAEGIHDITLKLSGYDDLVGKLTIDKTSYKKTFNYTLIKAVILPTLDIKARDETAEGANVSIDGTPSGTVPLSVKLSVGRHFIEVKREGYVTYSEWAELKDGGTTSLSVHLDAEKKDSTLTVEGTEGAVVYLDGVLKGNIPVLIDKIEPGRHLIEAKKEGFLDFRQWVEITAGVQDKLSATLAPAAPTTKLGSIKVFTDQDPAQVFLDGSPIGESPLTYDKVEEGDHYVQIRKEGYFSFEQNVSIKMGDTQLIQAKLTPSGPKAGSIRVISPIVDADVYIDGNFAGKVPLVKDDLSIGEHIIVVKRDKYADWTKKIVINGKDSQEFTAELVATGSFKVLSNLPGAEIFVDGEKKQELSLAEGVPLLFENVPAGTHKVTLRLPGYRDAELDFTVNAGETATADLKLVKIGPNLTDEERRKRTSTFSSRAVHMGDYATDLMIGVPPLHGYFAEATAITGAMDKLDVGINLRIGGAINEFFARAKYSLVDFPVFGVGVEGGLGGGFGPAFAKQADGSNDLVFTSNSVGGYAYGLASLYFRDILTVTTRAGVQIYSDAGPNLNVFAEGLDANGNPNRDQNLRDNGARLMTGIAVQLLQKEKLSYNLLLEGNPGGLGSAKSVVDGHPRRLMYEFIGVNDQLLYVRFGATIKF